MLKVSLLLMSLMMVGCKPFITNYSSEVDSTEFKYQDKVNIVNGFYAGQSGVVVGSDDTVQKLFDAPDGLISKNQKLIIYNKYKVRLMQGFGSAEISVPADEMELAK